MHRSKDPRVAARRLASTARWAAVLAAALALPPGASAQSQAPVARISVEAPPFPIFVLQATLPVPPGTYVAAGSTSPLAIVSNGNLATTQIEPVAWYAAAAEGASVVELIARVELPPGTAAGTEVVYDVVASPNSSSVGAPGSDVAALIAAPGSVKVVARDLNGNRYEADLFRKLRTGQPGAIPLRLGAHVQEHRVHEIMIPSGAATGHRLPHMMGVHATVRTYTGGQFLALDLNIHNGMNGRDFTTSWDDALADVYFDQLDLEVPAGWQLAAAYAAPYYGPSSPVAGGLRWPLVKALTTGQWHVLPQQAEFTRRYVLARTPDALNVGRAVLARRTQGFAVPGFLPGGAELWSWWNPATQGYLPQRNRLPELDFLSRSALKASLASTVAQYSSLLANGEKSTTGYPFLFGTLGWAHPWGVEYGGMTGGDEIQQWPGVEIAWARCQAGIRLMEIQGQCYADRQPVALYDRHGVPTHLESMVQPQGTHGPWIPTFFYLTPSPDSNFFGLVTADRTQVTAAYETFRLPYYEKDLKTYKPIDLQHLTRFLSPWLVLAWLTNDAEAKRVIELHAELNRITFSEYYNSNYGHVQGVGLLARMQMVQANGGKGGDWGRGVGWGLQASLAAYALGGPEIRARYRPWLAATAHTALASVSTCTGNATSIPIDKHFKGIYQSRQSFEASYFLHAVQGMRRSVFEGVDPAVHDELTEVLLRGAGASIQPPFWDPQTGAQWRLVATRFFPESSPDFCQNVPPDGYDRFHDHYTAMTTWAYAYAIGRDPIFLQRAGQAVGNPSDLEAGLTSNGLFEIADKAPMLALVQLLNR